METRKIYYVYENIKREINPIKNRISNDDFSNLLLNGRVGDLQIPSLFKESKIADFIDEWEVSGFTGEYGLNIDGSYFVKGDILIVREVKCPDDMVLSKFNSLSVGELDQVISKYPDCELKAQLVCSSNIPVSIDALAEIEFKPAFNSFRLLAKNKTDIHTFFDFYNYKDTIKKEVESVCNSCNLSLDSLNKNTNVYIYRVACNMADKIKEHFNFNNKPFIITDEIKDIYKISLQEYIKIAFKEYVNNYLEQNLLKGGKHR